MSRYDITQDNLLVEVSEGIATLTLNRPEQRNALSAALRANICRAILGANADPEVGAIILTGAGDKAFCAGLDLKELDSLPLKPEEMGMESEFMRAFAALDKPLVAAVNAVAVAGGLELVLLADFAIAADTARFADTHARVGILPAWGLTQTLPLAVGSARARYLCLTGNHINAATADDWGLVLEVAPTHDLMNRAVSLARAAREGEPTAVCQIRECVARGLTHGTAAGLALESELAKTSVTRFRTDRFAATREAIFDRGRQQQTAATGRRTSGD